MRQQMEISAEVHPLLIVDLVPRLGPVWRNECRLKGLEMRGHGLTILVAYFDYKCERKE